MPSFDTVSTIDKHELSNAVDQANREIGNRYDFKGSGARVEEADGALRLEAQSEFQVRQMQDIVLARAAKRGIDLQAFEAGEIEESSNRARQVIRLREGIDRDMAKRIVKLVKDSGLKVQAAVQGDVVRVTGKKRDDLQSVIALLRKAELGIPLQYVNFRD